MLTTHFIHFAIEPVTTTIALIAVGKALGVCGAGVGGATVGNALSQKANGKKKVNWLKAASDGTKSAVSTMSLVARLDDVISPTDNKPRN
ncbi:MAG: hypothetical protein F6K54_40210 [Okeania sp. SIO3B5]|uniref:hypothetical protein n=1 Tax=Okeania sp. SIO3B5 TaxID=2607811 RepID=UPI0013FFB306|nr:hypothetical protein [Okeania sp. SIO3B5]NEO58719.1 hypothetical protein [Okeania sp. SIO3B5]